MFKKITEPEQLKVNTQYLVKIKAEYPWFTVDYRKHPWDDKDVLLCYHNWEYSFFEFTDFKEVWELPN